MAGSPGGGLSVQRKNPLFAETSPSRSATPGSNKADESFGLVEDEQFEGFGGLTSPLSPHDGRASAVRRAKVVPLPCFAFSASVLQPQRAGYSACVLAGVWLPY